MTNGATTQSRQRGIRSSTPSPENCPTPGLRQLLAGFQSLETYFFLELHIWSRLLCTLWVSRSLVSIMILKHTHDAACYISGLFLLLVSSFYGIIWKYQCVYHSPVNEYFCLVLMEHLALWNSLT